MIKVFTTNKNGKIELTKDELKELLDEAYWDGYRVNNHSWTYTTPGWNPYIWTSTTSTGTSSTTSTLTNNTADVAINAPHVTTDTVLAKGV